MNKKQKTTLLRICCSAAVTVVSNLLSLPNFWHAAISLAIYLLIGHDILRKAIKGIFRRQIFDENFLMALATIGAIVLAFYQRTYDFTEATAVMLFYQLGELFESYAVGKSRKNISALMDIRPDYANVEIDGKLLQVDPDTVSVGECIFVHPGEKIPIDGIVLNGNATINTSTLTGESLPQEVKEGDSVISGCVNMSGVLTIQTTRPYTESTVYKILELVEESSLRKSKSEYFISKFSRIYTPAVCCSALALSLLPPIIQLLSGNPCHFDVWIYRALTFLVISCPCALVISIPLTFFAGIGGASRDGILIKGSNYLETLSKAKTIVMDKTGTLTNGYFQVTDTWQNDFTRQELLEYAALAECASSHPISNSIVTAYGKEIDRSRVTQIQENGGMGIRALVDGIPVAVGNDKLMEALQIPIPVHNQKGTVVHVAVNQTYSGYILVADTLKSNSKKAIQEFPKIGIQQTVILTGDSMEAANGIATELGLPHVFAQLLPADKVSKVEELLHSNRGKLIFVGDGINDAPVLSRADIGIAMGGMGSDAAIEAADVVLMDDDPLKIVKAIRISRKCLAIVYQNIIFALAIKFACLILGALGYANIWFAIFADVGVMVLAVLNAIRALKL